MFEYKPIKPEIIPRALEKAKRYRLLNEPAEAESICLDILRAEPDHQEALVWLLLSLTDQVSLGRHRAADEARKVLPRLTGEFEAEYYAGVIAERVGKHRLRGGGHGHGPDVHAWLTEAMGHFEKADALSADDNDDAILRWNSCARLIERHPSVGPEADEEHEPMLLE